MRFSLSLSVSMFALAGLSGNALTADLPSQTAEAPIAPGDQLVIDWTGVYGGIHGAYLWGELDSENFTGESHSVDLNGALFGGQLGVLLQNGRFVFGGEVDAGFGNIDGRYSLFDATEGLSFDLQWLATLRATAGIAYENFFIYGTAGAAFAELEVLDFLFDIRERSDRNLHGWAAGFGGSVRVSNNVSIDGQYLYIDLGDFKVDPIWWGSQYKYSATGHRARIAVNIHGNPFRD